MAVEIIGIRHHSPACARLVAHRIATLRPAVVLIEGPSDFNPRIDELLLGHELPIALYSFSSGDERHGQCWFPFVEYSPEWVALTRAKALGAEVRFIDLAHWQYRTVSDTAARRRFLPSARETTSRYAQVTNALAAKFGTDGDYALWDHLFESLPIDAHDELKARLDQYFDELRGDDDHETSEHDHLREAYMARWIAWAASRYGSENVLVVCGGWHKPALVELWPKQVEPSEPQSPSAGDGNECGAYLVPYEYRELDALAGYGAGMQSPAYYQWVWQSGAARAAERAVQQIVKRVRQRDVLVSTADLFALHHALQGLQRVRGHAAPLRHDVLDAVQSALIKEALESPAPWTADAVLSSIDHPVLREALLAITGEGGGKLADATPLPPLVHDVNARLKSLAIVLTREAQRRVVDRRRAEDTPLACSLWQLKLIGAAGISLTATRAPHAAKSLPSALKYEEHWQLAQETRWLPSLIEAAAFGATLAEAARSALLERLKPASTAPGTAPPVTTADQVAAVMVDAVRAGFDDLGETLADELRRITHQLSDPVALSRAGHVLLEIAFAGFWGASTRTTVVGALVTIAERLLWLVDGVGQAALDDDVAAVRVFDGLLRLHKSEAVSGLTPLEALEVFARIARSPARAPGLRGAALGLVHAHADALARSPLALKPGEIVSVIQALPPRDVLGDFLFGLFALARRVVSESDDLAQAIHAAIDHMGDDDFLVALPQLRSAFKWFPPRERGDIAALIARLMGLTPIEQRRLTQLPQGQDAFLLARRVEAQALTWASAYGIDGPRGAA